MLGEGERERERLGRADLRLENVVLHLGSGSCKYIRRHPIATGVSARLHALVVSLTVLARLQLELEDRVVIGLERLHQIEPLLLGRGAQHLALRLVRVLPLSLLPRTFTRLAGGLRCRRVHGGGGSLLADKLRQLSAREIEHRAPVRRLRSAAIWVPNRRAGSLLVVGLVVSVGLGAADAVAPARRTRLGALKALARPQHTVTGALHGTLRRHREPLHVQVELAGRQQRHVGVGDGLDHTKRLEHVRASDRYLVAPQQRDREVAHERVAGVGPALHDIIDDLVALGGGGVGEVTQLLQEGAKLRVEALEVVPGQALARDDEDRADVARLGREVRRVDEDDERHEERWVAPHALEEAVHVEVDLAFLSPDRRAHEMHARQLVFGREAIKAADDAAHESDEAKGAVCHDHIQLDAPGDDAEDVERVEEARRIEIDTAHACVLELCVERVARLEGSVAGADSNEEADVDEVLALPLKHAGHLTGVGSLCPQGCKGYVAQHVDLGALRGHAGGEPATGIEQVALDHACGRAAVREYDVRSNSSHKEGQKWPCLLGECAGRVLLL